MEIELNKPVLKILYQDEFLVAVDKPAGLFVHKSFLDRHEIYFALQLVRDQIGQYVYPVHRLDRPTSGVLLFALNEHVARLMNEMFANKTMQAVAKYTPIDGLEGDENQGSSDQGIIEKTYFALVRGFLSGEGVVDYPLKEPTDKLGDKFAQQDKAAQEAVTHYQTIAQSSLAIPLGKFDTVRYSLVKLSPQTGRRHQIRRHLSHLRHPIIGDINYGDNKQNPFFIDQFGFKRLMLIAKALVFQHPITGKHIKIEADFDQQWQTIFDRFNWQIT